MRHFRFLLFRPPAFFEHVREEILLHPFLLYLICSIVMIVFRDVVGIFEGYPIELINILFDLGLTLSIPFLVNMALHILLSIFHKRFDLMKKGALAHTLRVIYYGHSVLLLYAIPFTMIDFFLRVNHLVDLMAGVLISIMAVSHTAYIEFAGLRHYHGIGKKEEHILVLLSIIVSLVLLLHFVFHLFI